MSTRSHRNLTTLRRTAQTVAIFVDGSLRKVAMDSEMSDEELRDG